MCDMGLRIGGEYVMMMRKKLREECGVDMVAFIVGILGVAMIALSYLQKKRKYIILFNIVSRVLFVLQYILLGAFEGAIMDFAGIAASMLAQRKHTPLIKKHTLFFFLLSAGLVIGIGLIPYQSPVSLLPIVGVLLHTSALWLDEERWIRRVSLMGCPFWFAYNAISHAYGGCIGDIFSVASVVTAMIRYDRRPAKADSGAKDSRK